MDRSYAEPLDVRAVAAVAHLSEAHFIRSFRAAFGETPHHYLQRRRGDRSMFLLHGADRSGTAICSAVAFTTPGTTSRTFPASASAAPTSARAANGPPTAPTRSA